MKILYATSEALPFIASGGLADVAGSLPAALNRAGEDCRVVLPLYQGIKEELRQSLEYICNFTVDVSWRKQYCGVFKGEAGGVTYYFIDNEYYFKRASLYGYFDDAERFAFFSRAVLELISHVGFKPDILHCNDWQTALVSVYYNLYYSHWAGFENIRTVFTIHNIAYQGKYGYEILEDLLGIAYHDSAVLQYGDCINFMKGAIISSWKVTTVSPTYAEEIMDPWFSHGLDKLLAENRYKLCGILNGIDVDRYNSETDKNLAKNFTVDTIEDKLYNKKEILDIFDLPYYEGAPVIGVVTRLVAHKGLDLIQYVFDDIIRMGCQVVVLGSGDKDYEDFFWYMRGKYPDKVGVMIGFYPDIASKIYGGADLFLMPSKSEPCGLAQMISLRYGTIPIVRETGGLKDSIHDMGGENGNGFTFKTYNAHDMLGAISRAQALFQNKEEWNKAMRHAMQCDNSWDHSSRQYLALYNEILSY